MDLDDFAPNTACCHPVQFRTEIPEIGKSRDTLGR
ncbi:Uncharacterised protein [Vibrio cholerae]|nr:Uncharacterised protein [Vibrio cholerae]CSI51585.1 Uncharacterised protein [Vibrio cholerae]CSI94115.1 Uncharacterised protein [Vibrio cholerae]